LLYGSDVFCGWMYSETEFLKMFNANNKRKNKYYVLKKVVFRDTALYVLERCE
jgi:polyferredoxin